MVATNQQFIMETHTIERNPNIALKMTIKLQGKGTKERNKKELEKNPNPRKQ